MTWCTIKSIRLLYRKKLSWQQIRQVFNETGKLEEKFNTNVSKRLEAYWRPILQEQHAKRSQRTSSEVSKDKYYVLSMFPYPSGKLHMGHVRVYTISDVMARFHRMQGREVIHPMGWDAFGLPAENAAMERGLEPKAWTYNNIASMREQLDELICSFDWDLEFATCHPSYYKWTQFIFLKMFEAGLVYQKEAQVNWDPVDQTVLAAEQIDEDGRSWRSGAIAEKRYLKQWYIQTTAYTKDLIEGLEEVDTSLWRDVVQIQKNWLGVCDGCQFIFGVTKGTNKLEEPLTVFTRNPDLVYGISHINLSPSSRLNNPDNYVNPEDHKKKNFALSIQAIHPFTGSVLPIVVTKAMQFDEHNEASLAIPDISQTDHQIAQELDIPIPTVLSQHGEEEHLVNSAQFTGLNRKDAVTEITKYAKEKCVGGHLCSSWLKDWLISRQRYWGTPIPIIHCPNCKVVPVPFEDLPVELPELPEAVTKGTSPLAQISEWYNVKCPKCGGPATRETDTMDTFVDSSWYFFRYLDAHNDREPFTKERADKFMPVDLYIGGKEHAVLHLYYARFFSHFLHSSGYVSKREPFINLLTQGMVLGESYNVDGQYITKKEVDFTGPVPVEKSTGRKVDIQWEKMSKSKYNGVDPQEMFDEYGVGTTRLCILSNVAPKSDRKWTDEAFSGVLHFERKVWDTILAFIKGRSEKTPLQCDEVTFKNHEDKIFQFHKSGLVKVTDQLNKGFIINAAISRLHEYMTNFKKVPLDVLANSLQAEIALADLIIMLAPMAPAFASELWRAMASMASGTTHHKWDLGVFEQSWPLPDRDSIIPLACYMNGDSVFHIGVPRKGLVALTKDEVVSLVTSSEKCQKFLDKSPQILNFCIDPGYKGVLEFSATLPEKKTRKRKQKKENTETALT